MKRTDCANAEILAGAIALGEATETERDGYRRHVATCSDCLDAYGGEREIERVMATIAQARDEESWEPDLRAALRDRSRLRRTAWQIGLGSFGGALAAAIVGSFAIHALVASSVKPVSIALNNAASAPQSTFRVSLEARPRSATEHLKTESVQTHPANPAGVAAVAAAAPVPASHPVVVVHNVAAAVPVPPPAVRDAQKPTAHDENQVAALENAQTSPPTLAHQAESIAMTPRELIIRDAEPLPGAKPMPDPPAIAGQELAAEGLDEATTVYVVYVDERGVPTGCRIERPSGIVAVDEAVCRAAMKARFSPRTVNGRPTSGAYRDAFVFLSN